MSPKRAPMAPPDLQGFTYVDVLGSGGFADVYLYEQHLPKRRVAVKVLLTERMSTGSVAEFTAEANVMAMLSTHPAIVTIYQAGVARDGRPYLVMEYCPKPNLQVRYRREPFAVAETLRVGIQVAAAVETAHRAGVLHRDIKPANILVTEYNRPALTDFGIASTTAAAAESAGLSIPWSPPESFADVPQSGPRSDVYALGATVYTLLAGRSPFEVPDQRNTGADLIQRIETSPLPPLQRADAPLSLQRALERAMAKAPADRYDTALAFARALQKVQIELSHSVTPIDILDDGLPDDVEADDDDGLTRVRGVVSISPETSPAAGRTRQPTDPITVVPRADVTTSTPATSATIGAAPLDTVRRDTVPPPPPVLPTVDFLAPSTGLGETIARPVSVAAEPAEASSDLPPAPPRSRRGLLWSLAAGAFLVIVAAIIVFSLPGVLAGPAPAQPSSPATSDPQNPIDTLVAPATGITGAVDASGVLFTWSNPSPQEGDYYLWGVVPRDGSAPELDKVDQPSVTTAADASGTTCIEVTVVRANGRPSEPARGCTP
ncbi:serine/threonine-protein kinase [Microbacterium rhizomatis]|uniref:non-specific serine/threonine protein kinase n=1 Tax=Microbacterium rhizomatis TaxID=1631477 RepID=A0A5J5IYD3_9MICO|nr:serine/threonine-protein kinase [Microbacterium rhizomatis]KAA9106456.1 serine/threonine protein kinase [Microbacterium rhizomatis]